MTDDEVREQLYIRLLIGCESCGIRLSNCDDAGDAEFRDVGVVVVTVGRDWMPYCRQCAHRLFPHKEVAKKIGVNIEFWEVSVFDAHQKGD